MKSTENKQSKILQIVGIILIAWSIIRGSFLIYVLITEVYKVTPDGIIMIQGFHVVADVPLLGLVSWTRIMAESLLFLFGVIADSIAGIIGIANWKKPERAKRCHLWGIIAITINVVVMINLAIWLGAVSFGLHILYMIGVYQAKKLNT